jgi:hypothetical protein
LFKGIFISLLTCSLFLKLRKLEYDIAVFCLCVRMPLLSTFEQYDRV